MNHEARRKEWKITGKVAIVLSSLVFSLDEFSFTLRRAAINAHSRG